MELRLNHLDPQFRNIWLKENEWKRNEIQNFKNTLCNNNLLVDNGCLSSSLSLYIYMWWYIYIYDGGGSDLVTKLCLTLATLWTVAHQAPLSMGVPRYFLFLSLSVYIYIYMPPSLLLSFHLPSLPISSLSLLSICNFINARIKFVLKIYWRWGQSLLPDCSLPCSLLLS